MKIPGIQMDTGDRLSRGFELQFVEELHWRGSAQGFPRGEAVTAGD